MCVRVRVCVCVCVCVYLSQRAIVSGRGKKEREWSVCVCYIIQHVFSETTRVETILKRHKLNDGEWLLSHHWTVQTHGATSTWRVRFISPQTRRINMDASDERTERRAALCVFDLLIDWPQFRLMRFAPHTWTRFFPTRALIAGVGLSTLVEPCEVTAPVSYCCRLTRGRGLVILITAVIPPLPASPWRTNKQIQTHKHTGST